MSKFSVGANVLVSPVTKAGRAKEACNYRGRVLDTRTGVKCLGSVEYLIADFQGSQRWQPESTLTALQPETRTGRVTGTVKLTENTFYRLAKLAA